MATSLAFYASVNEQRVWLSHALHDVRGWSIANWFRQDRFEEILPQHIGRNLGTDNWHALRIFIGRSDLSAAPVWRNTSVGKEIDFIRSRAIQIVPSATIDEMMLEGRIDIMRASEYQRIGVDPLPLMQWFRLMQRSLEKMLQFDGAYLVGRKGHRSGFPSRRRALVSRDAAAWRHSGHDLKQVPESTIEFDVVLPDCA